MNGQFSFWFKKGFAVSNEKMRCTQEKREREKEKDIQREREVGAWYTYIMGALGANRRTTPTMTTVLNCWANQDRRKLNIAQRAIVRKEAACQWQRKSEQMSASKIQDVKNVMSSAKKG